MGIHFRFSTLVLVFLLLAVAFGKDDPRADTRVGNDRFTL